MWFVVGRLPAKQANEELVAAYRILEREEAEKILQSYRGFCQKSEVILQFIYFSLSVWLMKNNVSDAFSEI